MFRVVASVPKFGPFFKIYSNLINLTFILLKSKLDSLYPA